MSQNIHIHDCNDFPFDTLKLSNPIAQSGGTYLIRFSHNNEPIYIQPPKCSSKQGVIQSNRKFFIDLMFSNENIEFMEFLEKLEENCQQYIFKNKSNWFDGDIEFSDIENFFQSPSKMYKSGKFYLVRSIIPSILGKPQLSLYDEQENNVDLTTLTENDSIMSILEISGIKCSARTFQVVLEIKQMMKLEKRNLFSKCLLSTTSKSEKVSVVQEPIQHQILDTPKYNTETLVVEDDISEHDEEQPINNEESIVLEDTQNTVEKEDVPILEQQEDNQEDNQEEILLLEDKPNENAESEINIPKSEEETQGEIQEEKEIDKITFNDTENNNKMFSQNLQELELCIDDLEEQDAFSINERKDIYYKMYKDARKKAKIAKELALASYLEARNIKNTYMLEDIENSDSEDELETFETTN
jgi:hypothetical protein